jgi:hypothetical protein
MPSWDLPAMTANRTYPVLQFWTMAAYYYTLTTWSNGNGRHYGDQLLDSRKTCCGKLLVDLGVSPSSIVENLTVELVILSTVSPEVEATTSLKKDEIRENGGLYTVFYIEWEDGVAERRAMGHIYRNAVCWSLAQGPIWKEIILGWGFGGRYLKKIWLGD